MRVIAAALVALFVFSSVARSQTRYPSLEQEPACQSLMPAAAGGPLPQNPDVVVLRFLGVSNYELAYRDNVILLDAAIDKLAWWAPNNITTEQMTKHVNAIFLGHAHGEHLWDAPYIGEKTGALPAVHIDTAKFKQASERLESETAKLAQVSKSGDEAAVKGQIQAVAKACAACHDDFREKR